MSWLSPIRASSFVLGLLVAGDLSGIAAAFAQEGQEAPAPETASPEAPAAEPTPTKPKPKPKPRVAAPKPKAPETKPVEAEPKPAELKPADAAPAASGAILEPVSPAVWPNGARSLSESYGDWSLNCTKEGDSPDCVVIQSQGDRKTGRRQFSIELRAPKDGRAEGLILMPFGLQIEPGVTFKLDDRGLGKGAPYSFCVNDGCLVPISLPTIATDAMKTAQAMTVSGSKPDGKEPAVIKVPMSGFAAAFARSLAFVK